VLALYGPPRNEGPADELDSRGAVRRRTFLRTTGRSGC